MEGHTDSKPFAGRGGYSNWTSYPSVARNLRITSPRPATRAAYSFGNAVVKKSVMSFFSLACESLSI